MKRIMADDGSMHDIASCDGIDDGPCMYCCMSWCMPLHWVHDACCCIDVGSMLHAEALDDVFGGRVHAEMHDIPRCLDQPCLAICIQRFSISSYTSATIAECFVHLLRIAGC